MPPEAQPRGRAVPDRFRRQAQFALTRELTIRLAIALQCLERQWMNYSLDEQDNAVIVRVDGRVDESTWEAFGAGLSDAVQHAGRSGLALVIIDLSDLDYMSSRGLRVLTVAKREADEAAISISLASPNEVMREILAISRYDKLFTISDTTEVKE